MIPRDVESLALADAVGALDADEKRELDTRLARLAPDVQAPVSHLYDLAPAIAASAEEMAPSPRVRQALVARLAQPANYTLTAAEGAWIEPGLPGIRIKILALDRERDQVMILLHGQPGARYPAHRHSGPEECYVLKGTVKIEGRQLHAGDFHHADSDSDHGEISTDGGAEVLLIGSAADYLPALQ